jgi:hypothetical protein
MPTTAVHPGLAVELAEEMAVEMAVAADVAVDAAEIEDPRIPFTAAQPSFDSSPAHWLFEQLPRHPPRSPFRA